ncbi:hypothetical protein AMATHDRAFT_8230 [Amanita thiersii Skay4041]|uniref:Uncharacterized protein n=1 Tax=Amanita thiersii Skay4041 TaxID=703135 RepID=A0A2A9NEE3_9AGAR|nr:hypothetical protein AMATHDRAFT_8230 [Amanita thiersii Skay4041]
MAPYPAPFPDPHHCGTCKKVFTTTCVKKGHMVRCPKCDHWIKPGNQCPHCKAVEDAEERRKKEEEEKKKKEGDRGGKKKKKSGTNKKGKRSLAQY